MLLTREQLDHSAQPHPQVAEFWHRNPQPPPQNDPYAARKALRAHTDAILKQLGPTPKGLVEFDHEIPMRDGYQSSLKIVKPSGGPAGSLVVLLFGGGFVAGDKDQLTEIARMLGLLYGATVVCISYRLGPEHKFPFAQYDAWDSLEWIAENATGSHLNADPLKGFVVGGVSAGASISAALSRKLQEQPLKYPFTGQWLAVPSLMHPECCPQVFRSRYISLDQTTSFPGLSEQARQMMQDAVQWDRSSDLRYAANSVTSLSGQPRMYLQVCGMDPLRDDGLIYEEMLREAKVSTRTDFYPGCPHAYWVAMRGYEIGRKARIDTLVGIGWLLDVEVSRSVAASALGVSVA
ncbi:AB hydrolase superfamily protein B1A11.02 [Pseudocercospora fuligena]|uniref:AB hydrolase superfamily protein B1A11.02 n=1 Tax=Pseudocercospora fuligena TaxID=685502 RepID=A0A8H6VPD1_9PEZI|nr:AB hydrolase superfamily protein B1A11.02 [Pseudocercospora fuligena]